MTWVGLTGVGRDWAANPWGG